MKINYVNVILVMFNLYVFISFLKIWNVNIITRFTGMVGVSKIILF